MIKQLRIVSQPVRDYAKGQPCTVQIAGVCNHDPATTVLCHLPSEGHGMARKSDDYIAVFACSACHDVIDGRSKQQWLEPEDWYFYTTRALHRTHRVLIDAGLIEIKGVGQCSF